MKTIWFVLLIVFCTVAAGVYIILQRTFYHEVTPSVLRVGVLPDVGEENLHQRYDPLLNYLSAETGLKFKLLLPTDYGELVQMFRQHDVNLAYFGGLTFVQAHVFYQAEPLVMRNVDTRFTSCFLVRDGNPARDLADLKGKVLSFGNRLSTSGHLMPRHFIKMEKQIIPEEFFARVRYSGAHDKTAYLIRDGAADLGVANCKIIRNMAQDGRLKQNDLHVLWETPPYPGYVWAVQADLNEAIKTQLRDIFLGLGASNAAHNTILVGLSAKAFLPVGISEFLPLKRIAETLGLLELEQE